MEFFGNLGLSVREQGLNIVLNMFYNVTLNAARGIALQVSNVISGLRGTFRWLLILRLLNVMLWEK